MILSLAAVGALILGAGLIEAAIPGGKMLLGVILPYVAFAVFMAGFIFRVLEWAKVPVPFRIPTTCGQAESMPWIKQNKLDNPSSLMGVMGRMLLEVLTFRSLFRNTKASAMDLKGPRLVYSSEKVLWLAGIAFHYSFLVVFIRHFRLFSQEVPRLITMIEDLDGFMQLTLPAFYISGAVLALAVTFLIVRRLTTPQVKYISLMADYFPLFLILSIAVTGILMRYIFKTDIVSVKVLVTGLFMLKAPSAEIMQSINYMFYIHIFLVSVLLMYFPFSKLMHMGGVFMSPTRNLANNSRRVRHINPWNPEIKFHTYMEYEDDFREPMKGAGLPLEKDQ